MLIAAGYLETRRSPLPFASSAWMSPSLSFSPAEFPSFDGWRRISKFFDPYLGQMILFCYSMALIFIEMLMPSSSSSSTQTSSWKSTGFQHIQYWLRTTSMFFISPSSSTLSLLIYQRQRERGTRQHVKKVGLPPFLRCVGSLRTSRESSVGSNSSSSSIQQPKRERERERDSVNDARSGRRTIPKIFQR